MRVLVPMLFHHPDAPSGSTRLGYDHARALAERGHDVWILAQTADGGPPAGVDADGDLHVVRYESPRVATLDFRRAFAHQAAAQAVLERVGPESVDAIHGHGLLATAGALRAHPDAPLAFSVHSPMSMEMKALALGAGAPQRAVAQIKAWLNGRIERGILQRSAAITAESHFTKNALRDLHGAAVADRVRVVPGWADVDRFGVADDRDALKRQLGWPLEVPTLFTLRRLVPRNGIASLLDALATVRAGGRAFRMVISGGGPLQRSLEARSIELGLGDVVEFCGQVDDATAVAQYAACDAFVLPTAELECFGLPIVEAFASGRPVLATPVGAIPEVVGPVEASWLAASASADDIAELLTAFLGGDLPGHSPSTLRAVAESTYDRRTLTATLADVTEAVA